MKNHLAICICVALLASWALAGDEIQTFDTERWTILNGEFVEHLGRPSLKGTALLKDVVFKNGVIDVDIAVSGSRSYPGIIFRRQSPAALERFYVRPHRSIGMYSDTLQYTPVFNGVAGWQLYHGDGFTGDAVIEPDRWIHVRLEVLGGRARVFIDDASLPALEINELQHGVSQGAIGLMGPPDGSAFFSNFTYREDDELRFDPAPERVDPIGMITRWELSQPFDFTRIDIDKTPKAQGLTGVEWETVRADPSGLVDIARHRRWGQVNADWVWARSVVHAGEAGRRPFRFGYSDAVNVFVNGELVYGGNSAYRSRSPGFSGFVGLNETVYLPLKEGDNELLLLIGESFGGWGFMVQDAEAEYRHAGLTRLWELSRTFNYPESVVYDAGRDFLYVSNFFSGGNEFISRVTLDGAVEELKWVTGLRRPTGLCLVGNRLLAVERGALAEIEVESGEIVERYPIPDPGFPNDVACGPSGKVFVSDSQKSVVYRLADGAIEIWLDDPEVVRPNGLYLDGDRLIVGCSADGCLKEVDLSSREVRTIACLGSGSVMDGVRGDGHGDYVVSDFNGRAFLVSTAGETVPLLNTTPAGQYCADFEYLPDKGLLVVPTLNDNRLVVYRFDPNRGRDADGG
jgi:sugar lactone lactonase YvrE